MAQSGGIGFSTLNSNGGLTSDEMKRIQRLVAEEDNAIKAAQQPAPKTSIGDIPVVIVDDAAFVHQRGGRALGDA